MIKTFVSILGFMTIVAFSTSNVDFIKDYCSCEGKFNNILSILNTNAKAEIINWFNAKGHKVKF